METIKNVWFENERIYIHTEKGKTLSLALEVFPILKDATPQQRDAVVIEPWGDAMRWEEIDEDIHISTFYEDLKPNHDNEVAALFNHAALEYNAALSSPSARLLAPIFGFARADALDAPPEQQKTRNS